MALDLGNHKAEAVENHHEGFPVFDIILDSERHEMRGNYSVHKSFKMH